MGSSLIQFQNLFHKLVAEEDLPVVVGEGGVVSCKLSDAVWRTVFRDAVAFEVVVGSVVGGFLTSPLLLGEGEGIIGGAGGVAGGSAASFSACL